MRVIILSCNSVQGGELEHAVARKCIGGRLKLFLLGEQELKLAGLALGGLGNVKVEDRRLRATSGSVVRSPVSDGWVGVVNGNNKVRELHPLAATNLRIATTSSPRNSWASPWDRSISAGLEQGEQAHWPCNCLR